MRCFGARAKAKRPALRALQRPVKSRNDLANIYDRHVLLRGETRSSELHHETRPPLSVTDRLNEGAEVLRTSCTGM